MKYDDWKGSSAADNADDSYLTKVLRDEGLLGHTETIVGIKAWTGENHAGHLEPFSVQILVMPLDEVQMRFRKGPVRVRIVKKEFPIQQFFSLFKRFEVALSIRDEHIDDFEVIDEE
ncbi:MAG: hypothetical protein AB7K67_11400 [Hyphomicrobiaceae bacterium]